eukprot:7025436-Lingulodinium_polyedra.AAC.1
MHAASSCAFSITSLVVMFSPRGIRPSACSNDFTATIRAAKPTARVDTITLASAARGGIWRSRT